MLFEKATGWLGYTPKEALASNVNDLQIAIGGRVNLIKQVMGGSKDEIPEAKPVPVTAERFRAMAASHNAGWSNRGAAGHGRGSR